MYFEHSSSFLPWEFQLEILMFSFCLLRGCFPYLAEKSFIFCKSVYFIHCRKIWCRSEFWLFLTFTPTTNLPARGHGGGLSQLLLHPGFSPPSFFHFGRAGGSPFFPHFYNLYLPAGYSSLCPGLRSAAADTAATPPYHLAVHPGLLSTDLKRCASILLLCIKLLSIVLTIFLAFV